MKDDVFDGGGGFVGSDSDSGEIRFVTVYGGGVVTTNGTLARFAKRWSRCLDLLAASFIVLCFVCAEKDYVGLWERGDNG